MIKHAHLSAVAKECPDDCSFLCARAWQDNTLPYFCSRYDTFLGVSGTRRPLRCHRCRGVLPNIKNQGLGFIEAYADAARIPETKKAFLEMDKVYQEAFVDLIARTGRQIYLSEGKPKTSGELENRTLRMWRDEHDKRHAPQALGFKKLLESLSGDFALLTRETNTLLMNLFMVMDASEQAMLMSILQNQNQIAAFLEAFSKQPQDNDLLKNVRALVYDFDRQAEKQRELEQERQRRRQMEMDMARMQHQRQSAGRGK